MELMQGGPLTKLIKQKKRAGTQFTDDEASTIMRCILRAVAHIHSLGIVHRDLKPGKPALELTLTDNILVGNP